MARARIADDPLAPFAGSDGTAPGALPVDSATLRCEGLDMGLEYQDGTRFGLAAIREGRDGIRGELTVVDAMGRRLSWGALPLSSVTAREALKRKLDAVAPG